MSANPSSPSPTPSPLVCPGCGLSAGTLLAAAAVAEVAGVSRVAARLAGAGNALTESEPEPTEGSEPCA